MLAGFLEIPELKLDDEEAKQLLRAAENVGRHYASGAVPQKTADWISLLTAIGGVYGPRYFAMRIRMASEAATDVSPKAQPAPPKPRPNGAAPVDPFLTMHSMSPGPG